MKRMALGLAFLAVLSFVAASFAADDNPCPMDTLVKGFYCKACKAFTGKMCAECDKGGAAGCEDCKKGSVCNACKDAPCAVVDACERIGYTCEACKDCVPVKGDCEKCKTPRAEKAVLAIVVFKCADCGTTAEAAGACEKCKKDLVKACASSGTCPHVTK